MEGKSFLLSPIYRYGISHGRIVDNGILFGEISLLCSMSTSKGPSTLRVLILIFSELNSIESTESIEFVEGYF